MLWIKWISNLLLVLGLMKLGQKRRSGFILYVLGEIGWLIAGVAVGDWALVTLCVVFGVMAAWNWLKWGKDEGK